MLDRFFSDFMMQLVPPFMQMQLRGVRIDLDERARLKEGYQARIADAVTRVEAFSGRKLFAKKTISSQAMAKFLYTDLKLPVQKHPKTGRPTTNKRALEKLAAKVTDDKREMFSDATFIRRAASIISDCLDAELDNDNRLRTSFNLGGAETGRLSSSNSPWFRGGNVQNWTEDVRSCIIPDEGCCLGVPDGSQAEARVVAWLAQDRDMMHVFNSGQDVHKLMGSIIFDKQVDQITSEERYLAKRVVHAANYGMGKRTFATHIQRTERIAEVLLLRYFATFPLIKSRFHANVETQLEKTRTLTTPFGRRRQFFGRHDDGMLRDGYAQVPQSTVIDWANIGLLRLWNWTHGVFEVDNGHYFKQYLDFPATPRYVKSIDCMRLPIQPLLQEHDGLVTQFPIARAPECIAAIREAMTFEIPFDIGPLTIPVDIKVGMNWRDLHKFNSPEVEYLIGGPVAT